MEKLAARLRGLRAESGQTQIETAFQIGMSYDTYKSMETGKREPGISNVLAAAEHYGVSIDYLVGRTDVRRVST